MKEIKVHLEYPIERIFPPPEELHLGINSHTYVYKEIDEMTIRKDIINSILKQLGIDICITDMRDVQFKGFENFHVVLTANLIKKENN